MTLTLARAALADYPGQCPVMEPESGQLLGFAASALIGRVVP
jgi:hypothetical protein